MALTIQITGDASGVDVALSRLQGAIDQRMSAIETRLASGEQRTRQFSERSQKHIESLQKSFDGLQNTISRITGILATFGATVSIGALAKGAIETAAGFEQLDTQLRFVVGSMEAFQQARQFILQFTATTPFQLQEVSKAFIDLTRRGFDVQRTLKDVGDAASLTRFPSQTLDRVVFAMGQIADKGKLAQQELNQLAEAGIPITRVREELSKLGVKIGDDIGAAGISAKMAIEAILQVLEKDFAGAMKATQGNWVILTSNLVDAWNIFVDTIVRGPLFDFLKGLASLLLDELNRAITEDQAAFASMGATAVIWFKEIALWVAKVIDTISLLTEPLTSLQHYLSSIEQTWGNIVRSVAGGGLRALATGLEAALAPATTVEAVRKAAETLKQGKAGEVILGAIVPSKGAVESSIEKVFAAADTRIKELNAERDRVLKENEQRLEKFRRGLTDKPGGATDEGAKAAANAAKAQEQIIEQSLKRQEALISQSFDERRSLTDEFFADQVRAAPGEAEEIGKARLAAMRLIAQEEATMLEAVRLESNDKLLAATVDQLNKEKAAHAGKVADIAKIEASLQAAYEEHGAHQEAIFAKTAAVRQQLSKQATDEEIKDIIRANDIMEKSREQGLEDFAKQTREMQRDQERELDRFLKAQERQYLEFVNRVAGFLDDIFTQLMSGTLKAVDFFKRLLIQAVAGIASSVLAPIIAQLASGVAGILPGGIGGVIQGALGLSGAAGGGQGLNLTQGVGLLASMRTVAGAFTNGLTGLTDAMVSAGSTISTFFGGPALGTGFSGVNVGGAIDVGAGSAAGTALGAFGGAAALAGGIYGALKATNTASKAAYAASAAAGTAALASTALVAAGVIAASTGWTGIGLIAAAVTAIIGTITQMLIKPAGPALAVGQVSGLGVGVEGGRLAVSGDLGSRVLRREGVDRGVAAGVQARLEEGVTSAVMSIVQTINAVALDPAALLGPTQEALQQALRNIKPINSANAKKMEQDITEQLRFVNIQVVAGLLGPLNAAFDQLRDQGALQEQLDRLPGTTAGLVAVFKTMNEQLADISKVQNTDVLRQLSGVKSQVENFGNRIAGTAAQIAESIVTALVTELGSAGGEAMARLDRSLADQITDFSSLMQQSVQALTVLRSTQGTLEQVGLSGGGVGSQIDRLVAAISGASTRISAELVSTALRGLSADLNQILVQPLRIQATTVTSLFNDSIAALAALQVQWNQLNNLAIDTTGIREQFSRLVNGLLTTAVTVLRQSFTQGSFPEFLAVLTSIPDSVAALNPALAQLKQLGTAFAQVVGPMAQAISELEDGLRTTGERVRFTADQITDLRGAIADAGDSADQALPLYAKLAQALQANAAAQIAVANEVADAQIQAAKDSADAQMSAINDMADAATTAVNAWADAQNTAINAWADAWTTAINDAVDQQRALLDDWVETMTTAVNTWADTAQTTASQLKDVTATIMAEQSPAAQRQALLAQEATLAQVVLGGGPGSQQAMGELINVEKSLLALAKQSDDLKLQKDSLDKLTYLQKILTDQLVALTGQSDPILAQIAIAETQKLYLKAIADFNTKYGDYLTQVQAQQLAVIAQQQAAMVDATNASRDAQLASIDTSRDAQVKAIEDASDAQVKAIEDARDAQITAIKVDLINQLKTLEAAMREIFASQPVVRVIGAQRGGLVGLASGEYYAQGGLVPAMLEPRERVFFPPVPAGVAAMNRAIPRFGGGGFTVPGGGSGDTVPMMLPRGSFVMNRRAAGALGYQGGGMVTGGGMPVVNIHIAKLEVRNDQDIRAIIDGITRQLRREWRSPNGGGPFR